MTKFTHSYYQKVIHLRSKVYIKHTTIHIHGDNLYLDMCIYIFLQSLSLAARGELLGHKIVHQFGFSFKCIADLLKTLNLLAHINCSCHARQQVQSSERWIPHLLTCRHNLWSLWLNDWCSSSHTPARLKCLTSTLGVLPFPKAHLPVQTSFPQLVSIVL